MIPLSGEMATIADGRIQTSTSPSSKMLRAKKHTRFSLMSPGSTTRHDMQPGNDLLPHLMQHLRCQLLLPQVVVGLQNDWQETPSGQIAHRRCFTNAPLFDFPRFL